MATCSFFGHSECYGLDRNVLRRAIEELIALGVKEFLVGNHGGFDAMVFSCLKELNGLYPDLRYSVVLAYLPAHKPEYDLYDGHSIYPEGLEIGPQRFAIERRNRYLIDNSTHCIVFISHTWGGAYKFAKLAKGKGLTITNLGSAEL